MMDGTVHKIYVGPGHGKKCSIGPDAKSVTVCTVKSGTVYDAKSGTVRTVKSGTGHDAKSGTLDLE